MKKFKIFVELTQSHSIIVDANYIEAALVSAEEYFADAYEPTNIDGFLIESSRYHIMRDKTEEIKPQVSAEELELAILSARISELEAIISGSKQQSHASEEEQERDPVSRKRWTDKEMSFISQAVNSSHRKCHTLSWLMSKLYKNRTEDAVRRKLSSCDISISNDNLIKLSSCKL